MALNEKNLETRLSNMSASQGSIQTMSQLCLHYKNDHQKLAHIWMSCLQRAKVPHRLTLIYLANDIVQNAKRKNIPTFIEGFRNILKETVPYLKDDKIKKSVERVFSIWQDRSIFDSKFTIELKNALNKTHRGPQKEPVKSNSVDGIARKPTEDLMDSLSRLSNLEKTVDRLRSADDSIIDKLSQGTLSEGDLNDNKTMEDLKEYMITLRCEIDERNKLSKLLEESLDRHKKLLKESEEQLIAYKSQLEYVTKLRDDLG